MSDNENYFDTGGSLHSDSVRSTDESACEEDSLNDFIVDDDDVVEEVLSTTEDRVRSPRRRRTRGQSNTATIPEARGRDRGRSTLETRASRGRGTGRASSRGRAGGGDRSGGPASPATPEPEN